MRPQWSGFLALDTYLYFYFADASSHFSIIIFNRSQVTMRHGVGIFSLIIFIFHSLFFFFFGLIEKSGSISVFRMSVYSARRDFSERGLDEVSAVHGDPRLPTLGLGHLGPCSRDVLTVRLLKSTTTSTHYIVAR